MFQLESLITNRRTGKSTFYIAMSYQDARENGTTATIIIGTQEAIAFTFTNGAERQKPIFCFWEHRF